MQRGRIDSSAALTYASDWLAVAGPSVGARDACHKAAAPASCRASRSRSKNAASQLRSEARSPAATARSRQHAAARPG